MSIRKKLQTGGSKVVAGAMSVVLAVGLAPLPAFASDLQTGVLQTQAAAKSTTGTVICAGYAANEPAPQMLGLNNPEYRKQDPTYKEAENMYPYFGDDSVNEAVDPYLWNYKNANNEDGVIAHNKRTGGGPVSYLNAYDSTGAEESTQNQVWQRMPHIVLGTGASSRDASKIAEEKTYYQSDTFWSDAQKAALKADLGSSPLASKVDNYKPLGVAYVTTNLNNFVDDMYYLAEAAENVITTDPKSSYYDSNYADSSVTTRYGDPMEIAKDYERYVRGAKGWVLKAINEKRVNMKTVALVSAYNADTKTYTLEDVNFKSGTADRNRTLEALFAVSENYIDKLGSKEAKASDLQSSDVDLIVIGSQSKASDDGAQAALLSDGLADKTYYVLSTAENAGATFSVSANSVENAQNVGRVLPCLYPELLDQSDMIAYYYDTFYHIKDNMIPSLIAKQMDGVRNWEKSNSAAYTDWDESDVTDYNHDVVENMLKTGIAYLAAHQDGADAYLTLSKDASGKVRLSDTAAIDVQTITASNITKTLGSGDFALGATAKGNAKLSYESSNPSVATISGNGTVSLKGTGTTTITITAAATTAYGKAVKDITLTVNPVAKGSEVSDVSAGSSATAAAQATSSSAVTVTSATVKNNGTVTVNTVKINGKTYKVTAIAKAAFKGTKAKKITIGNNITTIGSQALMNAKKLTTLSLGKNVKSIGTNVLKGATKLKTVTLKTSKLTKANFKNLVKNSKIKTIKLSGVSKSAKAKYKNWAKSYKTTVK